MSMHQISALLTSEKTGCYCFECKEHIANEIEAMILSQITCLGILSEEDAVYHKMSVIEYLQFFAGLCQHKAMVLQAVELLALSDLSHVKLYKLTRSQLVRVKAAREMICDHEILYLKEPLRNLNEQDVEIMMRWIDAMDQKKKRIFITSQTLKDICMMPGKHYYIDKEKTIQEITNLSTSEEMTQPLKISAKLEDKIMLFNPNEIDYIESLDGKSYLYVRNSGFVCSLTMEELENKLKRFGFYRSHRSYLVNMQKVVEIVKWTRNSYSLKLEHLEEVRIPLSKGRMEEMKELYDF